MWPQRFAVPFGKTIERLRCRILILGGMVKTGVKGLKPLAARKPLLTVDARLFGPERGGIVVLAIFLMDLRHATVLTRIIAAAGLFWVV